MKIESIVLLIYLKCPKIFSLCSEPPTNSFAFGLMNGRNLKPLFCIKEQLKRQVIEKSSVLE